MNIGTNLGLAKMDRIRETDDQLALLASHLRSRRAAVLEAWRHSVDHDPELTAPSALPRTKFNDHIPELLDAYERKLHAGVGHEESASDERAKEGAAGHGLQRWQQGYHLREVTREWGHLHLCLVDELKNYFSAHPSPALAVIAIAWRALAELCSRGVSESTAQYFHLQQSEATGHVRDLEQTLGEVKELENRRAELVRQAAHDLRGQLGVVKNATTGLTRGSIPEAMRDEFLQLLQKSVASLHSMLDDVMDLARLQAGHELRDIKTFDAGAMLKDLYGHLRHVATERGLYLNAKGPDALTIQGDAVKIRRIAQNILINALKYTQEGGVTLCWGDSSKDDPERWVLCVEDTGPGFHAGPGAPLFGALEAATREADAVETNAGNAKVGNKSEVRTASVRSDPRPIHQEQGEGIGLSIVKRLCELLDASVEIESEPGKGTTFRVVLPRRYDSV